MVYIFQSIPSLQSQSKKCGWFWIKYPPSSTILSRLLCIVFFYFALLKFIRKNNWIRPEIVCKTQFVTCTLVSVKMICPKKNRELPFLKLDRTGSQPKYKETRWFFFCSKNNETSQVSPYASYELTSAPFCDSTHYFRSSSLQSTDLYTILFTCDKYASTKAGFTQL